MKTTWKLDPAHSEINFKVRHLMISSVKGEFKTFDAEIETIDENFNNATIKATVQAATIFTNNTDRDNHLKSADFFDVEEYPEITFAGSSFEHTNNHQFILKGDLTIKDITKEISLKVDFGGVAQDPYGNTKAGFSLSGKINRTDFGLKWNQTLEAGGVLVGEEVKISADLQFVKQ